MKPHDSPIHSTLTRLLGGLLWLSAMTYAPQAMAARECHTIDVADGMRVQALMAQGEIDRLLRCGLNINATTLQLKDTFTTPLELAILTGNPGLVQRMLDLGANPNLRANGPYTLPPLEVALYQKQYAIANVLLKGKADAGYALPNTGMTAFMTVAFDMDIASKHVALLELLVQHGGQVMAQDSKGQNALHWASRVGNLAYVQWLIQAGTDPCVRDDKDRRPADQINGQANGNLTCP